MNNTDDDDLLPIEKLRAVEDDGNKITSSNELDSLRSRYEAGSVRSGNLLPNSYATYNSSPWDSVKMNYDDSGEIIELDIRGSVKLQDFHPSPSLCLKNLSTLSLAGNALSVNEIKSFLSAIVKVDPPLQSLSLVELRITDTDFWPISRLICKAFKHSLKTLNLKNNKLGPDGALCLYETFFRGDDHEENKASQNNLTKLLLEGNGVGDDGVLALGKVLTSPNCQLTELNLSDNCVAVKGAKILADALLTNTTLTKLHLDGNFIGPDGALAFLDVIENKRIETLKELSFRDCNVGQEVGKRLAKALKSDLVIDESDFGYSFFYLDY